MALARHTLNKPDQRSHLVFLSGGVPVRRAPAALARRFAQICNGVIAEALAHVDLTPLQYAILNYLSAEPDIDQISLAVRIGIDRTSVGQLLDQLEAKGLVERRVNGTDRRSRLLRLTRIGEKLYRRVCPAQGGLSDRVLDSLMPAERETLLNLLVRVIEANETYARPGASRRKPSLRPSSSKTGRTP